MEEALKSLKRCLDLGLITQAQFDATRVEILKSPLPQIQAPPQELVISEESQKRLSFFTDRTNRMGSFEKPAISSALANFLASARANTLPLSENETMRLQLIKEVWSEWMLWTAKERTPTEYPVFLPAGDFPPLLCEFRRFLAEIIAVWVSYENRLTAPGSKEVSFGGLVAAYCAPKAYIEAVGLESVKRSPGNSFISALIYQRTPPKPASAPKPQTQSPQTQSAPNNTTTAPMKKCSFCTIVGHNVEECRKYKFRDAICGRCGDKGHTDRVCQGKKGRSESDSSPSA